MNTLTPTATYPAVDEDSPLKRLFSGAATHQTVSGFLFCPRRSDWLVHGGGGGCGTNLGSLFLCEECHLPRRRDRASTRDIFIVWYTDDKQDETYNDEEEVGRQIYADSTGQHSDGAGRMRTRTSRNIRRLQGSKFFHAAHLWSISIRRM